MTQYRVLASEGRQRYIYTKTNKNIKERKKYSEDGKATGIQIRLTENSRIYSTMYTVDRLKAAAESVTILIITRSQCRPFENIKYLSDWS
jgi:hypothetical protein